ncbi:hypothetical protein [Agrococcus jejuensis]|uniref:hypothetical protein n=1 Tax=Agrococcus jejuensis TaxID=399736 RepID=UPI00164322D0|nr:hypothetical protein [Agrococcus jejuensis]
MTNDEGQFPTASNVGADAPIEGHEEVDDLAGSGTPRSELEVWLTEDESRLGDVYRLHVIAGLAPADVATHLNIETFTFVYQYKTKIDAILDGVIPSSETLRRIVASTLRAILKRNAAQFSSGGVEMLSQTLERTEQALRRDSTDARVQVSAQVEREAEERAWQNQSNLSGSTCSRMAGISRIPSARTAGTLS